VHCPSGGFEPRDAGAVDEPLWDAAMDSTAKGFMFAAQAAHEVMADAVGGVIVAITDVAGLQAWPRFAPHGAAKAAQIHLLKCLALAWGRDGVRVCGVAPGPVLMPEGIAGDPDETALGRLGDPADVAQAVRYCIEADFVTGQNIVVDGGRLLRP
jgi:pteridine reductase